MPKWIWGKFYLKLPRCIPSWLIKVVTSIHIFHATIVSNMLFQVYFVITFLPHRYSMSITWGLSPLTNRIRPILTTRAVKVCPLYCHNTETASEHISVSRAILRRMYCVASAILLFKFQNYPFYLFVTNSKWVTKNHRRLERDGNHQNIVDTR